MAGAKSAECIDAAKLTRLIIEIQSLTPAETAALVNALHLHGATVEIEAQPHKALPDNKLLSPREVAVWLDVSRSQVYNLINSGELPSTKVGSQRRIVARDVEAYIERQREEV